MKAMPAELIGRVRPECPVRRCLPRSPSELPPVASSTLIAVTNRVTRLTVLYPWRDTIRPHPLRNLVSICTQTRLQTDDLSRRSSRKSELPSGHSAPPFFGAEVCRANPLSPPVSRGRVCSFTQLSGQCANACTTTIGTSTGKAHPPNAVFVLGH